MSTNLFFRRVFFAGPPEIQTTQIENVEKMVCEVDVPLSKLTNDKMRHLLLLKNSEKYLDRLTDRLQSQLRLCDKMEVRNRT